MSYEIWLVKSNEMINITPIVGTVAWSSDIDELAEQLTFEIAYNDNKFFPINPCDIGDLVILKNDNFEIFRGIIFTEQKNGRSPIQYICFDYLIYLNKSKDIYQFNGVGAKKAISKILNDYNIPIGDIANINTKIDKIYHEKTIAEIIKDILDQVKKETGIKYWIEMRNGKLYIKKQADMLINPTFKLANNLQENYITDTISNPSRKRSIEDMRNSIKIVATNDKKVIIKAEIKDDNLIKKYGLLQEVQKVDEKDITKAKNIAKNLLSELGKVFEETAVEMLGNDEVKAGRLIQIEESITGMTGRYLIKNVSHNLDKVHTMSLSLEAV